MTSLLEIFYRLLHCLSNASPSHSKTDPPSVAVCGLKLCCGQLDCTGVHYLQIKLIAHDKVSYDGDK